MVASSAAEHRISDGVGIFITAAPTVGVAVMGYSPDHAGLIPCLTQAVGVVDVCSPLATVIVKGLPSGGLNGEGSKEHETDSFGCGQYRAPMGQISGKVGR